MAVLEYDLCCNFFNALVFLPSLCFEGRGSDRLEPRAFITIFGFLIHRPLNNAWLHVGSSIVHRKQLKLLSLKILQNLKVDSETSYLLNLGVAGLAVGLEVSLLHLNLIL
jgi:hypothetical protein